MYLVTLCNQPARAILKRRLWFPSKTLLAMKLTIFFFTVAMLNVSAKGVSQNISLSADRLPIEKIFTVIKQQTGYVVFYNYEFLEKAKPVTIKARKMPLEAFLQEVFRDQPLNYLIKDRTIVISRKTPGIINNQVADERKAEAPPASIISGIVRGADGVPLSGASVKIKGTSAGVSTDADGRFSIDVNIGQTLVISYIGYEDEEIVITSPDALTIQLTLADASLEETVVVGYGTQKKINLTGAVKQLDGEELMSQPSVQTSAALMGKVAGVQITQNSGQPGQNTGTIRIRGTGTLGDANPLILIDGIPGDLNSISSTDIASVSVLKDASASAVYGSRAANGVILVTTKRGSKGKAAINYNNFLGWKKATDQPKFVDGATFMELQNMGSENMGMAPIWSDTYIEEWKANHVSDPDNYPSTNWVDEAFTEPGLQQRHQIGISGGSDQIRFFGSLSYDDERSNIPNYGFKRYSIRMNTDISALKNLNINFDILLLRGEQTSPSASIGRIITDIFRVPSVYVSRYSHGGWGPAFNLNNPTAYIHDGGLSKDMTTTVRPNLGLNYKLFNALNLRVAYSPDLQIGNERTMVKSYDITDPSGETVQQMPSINSLTQRESTTFNQTLNATLHFQKYLGKHTASVLGGYEFVSFKNSYFQASRDQFLLQDLEELNAGAVANQQNNGSGSEWSLRSFFGRLNYNYDSKYLLEANLRYDGSSRFSAENRWGLFPSFSAGWVVSEEPFMKSLHFLSHFKVRGSWGVLGNQNIGTYPYISTIDLRQNYVLGGVGVTGAAQLGLANSGITWEQTASANLGFDIAVLQNRVNFSLDLFNRKTSDILLQLPVPLILGLSAPFQNAGAVGNKGWEMELGYKSRGGKDFSYEVSFSVSDVKNRVTDLKGAGPFISGDNITMEGVPIQSVYGYQSNGFFNSQQEIDAHAQQAGQIAPGDIRYVDQNKDGVINADDRVVIGDPFPSLNYGINLAARYKNFDISVFFQGIGRRNVYLSDYAAWPLYNGSNIREWQARDFWTPERMNASMPRFTQAATHSNFSTSDFWVYDASYLRLRNLQLGYTLSATSVKRLPVDHFRLFLLAENLATFFNKMPQGVDPNVPNGSGYFPISRLLAVGMNVKF